MILGGLVAAIRIVFFLVVIINALFVVCTTCRVEACRIRYFMWFGAHIFGSSNFIHCQYIN